jgi:hypothetical protein
MISENQEDASIKVPPAEAARAGVVEVPAPAETTNGMVYIFPFLCSVAGQPVSIEIPAETRREAEFALSKYPDLTIVGALTARPHPDCFKERQVFNLKQAAAFLGLEYDTVQSLQGGSKKTKKKPHLALPKAANGRSMFTRRRLISYACAVNEKPE